MIRTPSLWPAILLGAMVAIDGDTVRMDGKSYRLLGLDTPETYHAMCHREYEAGQAARRRLEALIAQGATLHPTGRDCRYQRECANLQFKGEDVAEIMIREGHAVAYNGRGPRERCAPAGETASLADDRRRH